MLYTSTIDGFLSSLYEISLSKCIVNKRLTAALFFGTYEHKTILLANTNNELRSGQPQCLWNCGGNSGLLLRVAPNIVNMFLKSACAKSMLMKKALHVML